MRIISSHFDAHSPVRSLSSAYIYVVYLYEIQAAQVLGLLIILACISSATCCFAGSRGETRGVGRNQLVTVG